MKFNLDEYRRFTEYGELLSYLQKWHKALTWEEIRQEYIESGLLTERVKQQNKFCPSLLTY